MRVRLGCLSVHERTSRFARRHIAVDDDVEIAHQPPCPACGASVESIAHLMFECPVSATARTQMFDIIKLSDDRQLKLMQCLNLACDKKKVARFVSCDLWKDDTHGVVSKAIAAYLQKAWRVRNAYKHGSGVSDVDVSSAFMRRGADGIDARA